MTDIFVLPSYSEGLPNVLLEAAMCGLAIVASDIGGNRDVISSSKLGILYPVGNIMKLSESIQELINNSKQRIDFANSIYEMAHKKFSLTQVSEQYQELYSKLIE
jgi:glycosyltransferase involved in cell wall biosynthesis